MNIVQIICDVLQTRPFHSEADLQHEVAWRIHQQFPKCSVRLEMPLGGKQIDIYLLLDGKRICVELKYKVANSKFTFNEESFHHRNSGGQPQALYDFLKDITRIESLVRSGLADSGFAIFVTTQKNYRLVAQKAVTVRQMFGIHHGCTLSGIYKWPEGLADGTKATRIASLEITGKYELVWNETDVSNNGIPKTFYLIVQI